MRQRIHTATLRSPDLRGSTVVVTRPSASAASLLRRVRRLGAAAVALPGIALRVAEDAATVRRELMDARKADLLIFVSPAAARFAWQLAPTLRFPARVQVAAVGAATARALRRHGVVHVLQPHIRQDADALLELEALRNVRGQSVVLIGAPEGRDTLPQTLRQRGARLRLVDVYQRVAPRWTRTHLARLATAAKPRLLLVSSALALANLATRLPPGLSLALRDDELVVSSQRLAGVAREHGYRRIHVARSALSTDLIDAAIAALGRHRL